MASEQNGYCDPTLGLPPSYADAMHESQAAADRLDAKDRNMAPQPTVVVQPGSTVTTTTTVSSSTIVPVFGDQPVEVRCHQCLQTVVTTTEKSPKGDAYICACFLCISTVLLCCWIPFMLDSMYKTIHKCPVCHAYLGSFNN